VLASLQFVQDKFLQGLRLGRSSQQAVLDFLLQISAAVHISAGNKRGSDLDVAGQVTLDGAEGCGADDV
jgi:hypothetical protein